MRLYKLFLFLYPSSFRAEYEVELCRIFEQRRRDTSGTLALLIFWLQELFDVLQNAVRVHWDIFRSDIRYTTRTAFRRPGFAITAILVTALGIGANTAVFSVVNHVLIRPLPYENPDRIVRMWQKQQGYRGEVSPPNYRDWQQRSQSFESVGAYWGTTVNLVGSGTPERIDAAMVTPELLPLLGVKPVLGRLFLREEDRSGTSGTVLLSFGLWQSRFGSSGAVLGQKVRLNDEPFTVIGVLPANFTFPDRKTRLWIPFRMSKDNSEDRGNTYLYVLPPRRCQFLLCRNVENFCDKPVS